MKIQINGQPAKIGDAYKAAANILSKASLPLIAGLGTDIAGAKAALNLAQKSGAIVDHLASDSLTREMRLLSYTGGFGTTPGESRNRTDLILIVGKLPLVREPDLIKRLFPTGERLPSPGAAERTLILLSGRSDHAPANVTVDQIDGTNTNSETLLGVLSAYVKERPVVTDQIGEELAAQLKSAGEKLAKAKFAVIIYSAGELSEPAIHCIRDLVNTLNDENRASALPIAGRDNIVGVNQTCGWTTGFPLRTSFARGKADYNPHLYETNRLLAKNEADALLWVSSFTKTPPPNTATTIPQIVLSLPGTRLNNTPDILIEVGQPGEDHDGAIFNPQHGAIVAMKAKNKNQPSPLSASEALANISNLVEQNEGAACS